MTSGPSPWLYAVRRLGAVLVVIIVGLPLLLLFATRPSSGEYTAVATVTAVDFTQPVAGLGRFADVVFQTADVAERIRAEVPVGGNPLLPPEQVTVEPVQDTIVVRLLATDPDPARAALLANAAASALASELNELGPTTGEFVVSDRARQPVQAVSRVTPATLIIGGIVAALALGVAIVVLWVSWRRPVLSAEDLRQQVGAEWDADLYLGATGRWRPPGRLVGVGQIDVSSPGTTVVAGASPGERWRLSLSCALATLTARGGPTELVLVGPGWNPAGVTVPGAEISSLEDGAVLSPPAPGVTRIIDVDARRFAVDFVDTGGAHPVLLVADAGVSARHVSVAAAGIDRSRLSGVVLIHPGR